MTTQLQLVHRLTAYVFRQVAEDQAGEEAKGAAAQAEGDGESEASGQRARGAEESRVCGGAVD